MITYGFPFIVCRVESFNFMVFSVLRFIFESESKLVQDSISGGFADKVLSDNDAFCELQKLKVEASSMKIRAG